MRKRPLGRRGFSLLELLISVTVGAAVLGTALRLVANGSAMGDQAAILSALDERSRNALDRIGELLRPALISELRVENGTGGARWGRLVFTTRFGEAGPVEHWIEIVPAPGELWDGIDTNGDGLVDEGRLLWIRDPGGPGQQVVTLCDGLTRAAGNELPDDAPVGVRGFNVQVEDGIVQVSVSVARRSRSGELLQRNMQRWFVPRN
jgi:prepilin-type N-terminal cleavage/methylation domain-containing protein